MPRTHEAKLAFEQEKRSFYEIAIENNENLTSEDIEVLTYYNQIFDSSLSDKDKELYNYIADNDYLYQNYIDNAIIDLARLYKKFNYGYKINLNENLGFKITSVRSSFRRKQ